MMQKTPIRKKKQSMLRLAIIITAPGQVGNYLPYCDNDGIRMKKYLMSDYGGAWVANEMLELRNCTKARLDDKIKNIIDNYEIGYVLFYFSGHGAHSDNGDIIALQDRKIYLNSIPTLADRELFITDSCRVLIQPTLEGITQPAIWDVDYLNPASCKELVQYNFAKAISEANIGRYFVKSCSVNQTSTEDDFHSGGIFTTWLLETALGYAGQNSMKISGIQGFWNQVVLNVRNAKSNQTPTLSNNSIEFPFVINPYC